MKYIKKFEDYVASFSGNSVHPDKDDEKKFKKTATVSTNENGFVIECDGKKVAIESGIDEGNEEVPAEEIAKALENFEADSVTFENTDGETEVHPVNEFLRKLNPLHWKLSSKHRSIVGHVMDK